MLNLTPLNHLAFRSTEMHRRRKRDRRAGVLRPWATAWTPPSSQPSFSGLTLPLVKQLLV